MRNIKILIVTALLFVPALLLNAQETKDTSACKKDIKLYISLYHQHHDFFGTAFSYQGLEGGITVKTNLFVGIYGAFFVSNLKTVINGEEQLVWIGQGGINSSYLFFEKRGFHPGIQLNIGLFGLRSDDYSLNGMVLSPQIFGEFAVKKWFRIRTGLAYNLYGYKDHTSIQSADLKSLSFNFALLLVLPK